MLQKDRHAPANNPNASISTPTRGRGPGGTSILKSVLTGRFPLTPVLQTEARALKGHLGAQQMEADASPILRPLSIDGQYL